MRQHLITVWNDGDEKLFSAGTVTESDHPVRLYVRVNYPENWGDQAERQYGRYYVSIDAVSPDWVEADNPKEIVAACESHGVSRDAWASLPRDGRDEVLMSYGVKTTLWQGHGNNLRTLLRTARKELATIKMLFGFYMDKPQNALGSSGWDFIIGDAFGRVRARKGHE